jgi:hypothetical protein
VNHINKVGLLGGIFALCSAASAQDNVPEDIKLSLDASEKYESVGHVDIIACTKNNEHAFVIGTDIYISGIDTEALDTNPADFGAKNQKEIIANITEAWKEITSEYSLQALQTDMATLNEYQLRVNNKQTEIFDAYEEKTGVDVMTDSTLEKIGLGCSPDPVK